MGTPRIGWYGDDFTGATDTLAVLTQGGLRAMLFLGVPDARQQQNAAAALGGPLQAIGIAGASRSMPPARMEAELEPVGRFFASLRVPVLHYKVCSTFDSAPEVGNIATAVRVLRSHVENAFVPIVGGQPGLGRYCVFSNLFAAAGRGMPVERIDRHPTMSRHPVTPMQEADLRRHLALQGLAPVAGLHYPAYAASADEALATLLRTEPAAVLLDVGDASHLAPAGRLVWEAALRQRLLAIGPSGVEQALLAHWNEAACVEPSPLRRASTPVFAFAGSLSPVTARQVQAATSYQRVPLQAADLFDAERSAAARERLGAALRAGRHVLAFTAPQDGQADTSQAGALAAATARFVASVLRDVAARGLPLARVGIAGGDTSSLAAGALGLWGLSYRCALGPGVTVSRTHSDDGVMDGIELMLKGGQMGGEDVFEQLLA